MGRDNTVLAGAFRLVEGRVGCLEQLVGRSDAFARGNAEACRDRDRTAVDGNERSVFEGRADALGNQCAARDVGPWE